MTYFRGIRVAGLIATFAWLSAAPSGAAVSGIYWSNLGDGVPFPVGPDIYSDTHHIGRFDLATGQARPIRYTGDYSQPEEVVLDSAAGHIYWFDNGQDYGLYRSNRDGGQKVKLLGADPFLPYHAITGGAALDAVHGQLYWPEVFGGPTYSLWRYDIRNPGAPELYLEGLAIRDIAIDSTGEYAYWASMDFFEVNQTIGRIHLETGQINTLITFSDIELEASLISIALDEVNGRLYWSAWSFDGVASDSNGIWRSNLDGSGVEHLASVFASSMAIDPFAGQLYWGASLGFYRTDLDINNIETLLSSIGGEVLLGVNSIALDPNPIPLPGAAWAGLGLLGALALRRR